MAEIIISDPASLKKQALSSQEDLLDLQYKIEAMLNMLLRTNLIYYPTSELYGYIRTISDLFDQAISLNKLIISETTKVAKVDA